MTFTLREDQQDILAKARDCLRRNIRRILLQAPTGFGKTCLAAEMLGNVARKGKRAWFVVHRRELIRQATRTFRLVGIPHGIIAAGWAPDRRHAIQVCSIGTLARRLDLYEPPDVIVLDECHHVAAASWAALVAAFPNAIIIGLSATPCRLDGRGLDQWFDVLIPGPPVRTLIEQGSLAPYRLFAPGGIDTSALHSRMGEFIAAELRDAADKPKITGDAIAHYRKICDGKQAVVFGVSIEHSEHIAEQFRQAGYSAEHVDGTTHDTVRDNAIERFERGELQILSNVDLFGEGFDVPAIEAVIDLAPTMSLTKAMQRWGRALRPFVGKNEAFILDHAGNAMRHGLPDDEREWSLEGIERGKKKPTESPIRQCPKCYAAMPAQSWRCGCGFEFPVKSRKIDEVDGELAEVDPVEFRRQLEKQEARRSLLRDQGMADSIEALTKLGARRGMKNPEGWARHVLAGREEKERKRQQRAEEAGRRAG